MTKKTHTIHDILSDWGRSQQLTKVSQDKKNTVLNHLPAKPEPSQSPRPGRKLWLPLAVAGLSMFFFVIFVSQRSYTDIAPLSMAPQSSSDRYSSENYSITDTSESPGSSSSARMEQSGSDAAVSPAPSLNSSSPLKYKQSEIPISDNRQFLKTDYSASIKTRKPQETASRVQTMVRGYDGRIDSASSSAEYGSIAFAIPATKLDAFRAEIKQVAGARFIIEQTSTQNLLPEKQVIEADRTDTQTRLADLTAKRDQLTAGHNQTVGSLESKLKANSSKLANLQAQWNKNPDQRPQIEAQQRQAQQERANLNSQLSAENSNYPTQLNALNGQIESLEKTLKNIDEQDSQLTDTVATVQGTISISKINLVQFVNFYLPDYWALYVSVIAAVTAFILYRRRNKWVV